MHSHPLASVGPCLSVINLDNMTPFIGIMERTTDVEISTPTQIPLIFINLIFLLVGLAGNTTVLVVKQTLHKVDKFIVKQLATADLLLTVTKVLPAFVTICCRKWVLGTIICVASAYVPILPHTMELILMPFAAIHKAYVVSYPIRAAVTSNIRLRRIKKSLAFIWLSAALVMAVRLFFQERRGVEFKAERLTCEPISYRNKSDSRNISKAALLIYVVSCVTMFISTAVLIIVCYRYGKRTRALKYVTLKSFVLTAGVCTLFTISVVPAFIGTIRILVSGIEKNLGNKELALSSLYFSFINISLNSVVYVGCHFYSLVLKKRRNRLMRIKETVQFKGDIVIVNTVFSA